MVDNVYNSHVCTNAFELGTSLVDVVEPTGAMGVLELPSLNCTTLYSNHWRDLE